MISKLITFYFTLLSFIEQKKHQFLILSGVEFSPFTRRRYIIRFYHLEFISSHSYLFLTAYVIFLCKFFNLHILDHYLYLIHLFPYISICGVGLIPLTQHLIQRQTAPWKITSTLVVAVFLLGGFILLFDQDWSQIQSNFHFYGLVFFFDRINTPFVLLVISIFPLIVLASVDNQRGLTLLYYGMLFLILIFLLLTFTLSSFFGFYIAFELLGFPMFLLIALYGPRTERIQAGYKFFLYTFLGSSFILPVLVYFYFYLGSTHFLYLTSYRFTDYEQCLFFGLCSFPFLVKIPVIPLHLWLPEAHVEASTPISMILAALLLKTGGYAFLRFLIPIFPYGVYFWSSLFSVFGIFSIFYASLYALVQVDLKKMIAYSSVAHMSLVFLGLMTKEIITLQGAVFLMITHGYTSAGLFAGIGVVYDRYRTRTIRELGGIASLMPIFTLFYFYFILGNISFPFTGSFAGEFYLLLGLIKVNSYLGLLAGSTVFLSICYSMWLFNRIFYGQIEFEMKKYQDLTGLEVSVCYFLSLGLLACFFKGSEFIFYTQSSYASILRVSPLSIQPNNNGYDLRMLSSIYY